MDWVLQAVPSEVGFYLEGAKINYLAFADDLVLVTSSVAGMRVALARVESTISKLGMELSPGKCRALSLVPARMMAKIRVVEDTVFYIGGAPVKQMHYRDSVTYLGVPYRNHGAEGPEVDLDVALQRIGQAPLKPQQRLIVLRCHLLPRYVHGLVLGGSSRQSLKKFDIKVRAAVRRWLKLPRDVPLGYFHAPCAGGGLGVSSMSVLVPALTLGRLLKLERSGLASARAAFSSTTVARRLREAREALVRQGLSEDAWCSLARKQWWTQKLYSSNDGAGLKESNACKASSYWLDKGLEAVSGWDFVQCVRTHINALPTTVRSTRGRRDGRSLRCRAGCLENETGTHAVQKCYVSRGGRCFRHDSVVDALGEALAGKGYVVHVESVLRAGGRRWKPDMIVEKNGRVTIVDAQVVNAAPDLNSAHRAKCRKYGTLDVRLAVGRMFGVSLTDVGVTSCTLSWRGVWSRASARSLELLGVPMGVLKNITTRVLKGSSIIFSRWRTLLNGAGR